MIHMQDCKGKKGRKGKATPTHAPTVYSPQSTVPHNLKLQTPKEERKERHTKKTDKYVSRPLHMHFASLTASDLLAILSSLLLYKYICF